MCDQSVKNQFNVGICGGTFPQEHISIVFNTDDRRVVESTPLLNVERNILRSDYS